MRYRRVFTTVDTHTCGDPTRTVMGGIPHIPGTTIAEKMLYLKEEEDWIRRVLMDESRRNQMQSGVILTEPCSPEATMSNATVVPPGVICRSPCGTGTCAKLAQLHCKRELGIDENFVHESATTSTIFKSRILEETGVGEFPAVVPEVTGSAYVTGMHTFVIDPEDPFQEGFRFRY